MPMCMCMRMRRVRVCVPACLRVCAWTRAWAWAWATHFRICPRAYAYVGMCTCIWHNLPGDPPGCGDVNADVGRKGEVACAQVEQVVDVLDDYCVVVEEEHTAVLYQLEHLHLGKRTNAVPLKRLDLALLDSFRHEPLLNAVTHADTEAQQWVRCLDTHQ